jgi:hypothetical protein
MKWRPNSSGDSVDERTKAIVIAYDAAELGYLRGNVASPAKHIKKSLLSFVKARNKHAPTFLVPVDEYLTSQICPICNCRTTKHAQDQGKEDVYPVLVCSKCNTIWNRDHMASLNIRAVFMHMADNSNKRPAPFKRPPKKKVNTN